VFPRPKTPSSRAAYQVRPYDLLSVFHAVKARHRLLGDACREAPLWRLADTGVA
jgi:hypothetical protein